MQSTATMHALILVSNPMGVVKSREFSINIILSLSIFYFVLPADLGKDIIITFLLAVRYSGVSHNPSVKPQKTKTKMIKKKHSVCVLCTSIN